MMSVIRWFFSRTVRQATEMRKHVLKLLRAQEDLLTPPAIDGIRQPAEALRAAIVSGAAKAELHERMNELEKAANRWLKPYPHASTRENVEVILVAVAVALAIRTFFLQPMKIPTGSMQPTLYGITTDNLIPKPGSVIPGGLQAWIDLCYYGISYYHVVAQSDGEFVRAEPPQRIFPFVKKQRFLVGDTWYTIWFPPDTLPQRAAVRDYEQLFVHAGVQPGHVYHKGDDIIKLKMVAGDHLFVNRMTYNFRPPKRGEIIIFETRGIDNLQQDTFYIKRLVALGGEKVRIGNDQHLVIDGKRLDASTPHFENVYTFGAAPREYQYFGHVNNLVAARFGQRINSEFTDETKECEVRPRHYMVMGDNTMNSLDSRYWGDFSEEKVIGKSSFVYWPVSRRFGWGYR
jgi:signal peptidase I